MEESGIVLDFSKARHSAVKVHVSTKIVCTRSCVLPPNSETVIQGKLNKDVYVGMQGQCLGHSDMGHKGLLVVKAVVTCLPGRQVPVKILNPTAESVHINKGAYLATFKLCDNYTDILSVRSDIKQCKMPNCIPRQSDAQSNLYFASKDRDNISFNDGAQPDISK